MKIDRLIGILTVLLRQGKTTERELAERFEVSVRTIGRDVDALCKANIPVAAEQGYGGGVRIADGYAIDRALLTADELAQVLTGLKSLDSVSRTSHARKLMEKLGIGPGAAGRAEDAIVIDLAAHDSDALAGKIETLRRAIRERKLVTFRYYYGKGECVRRVEPYLLLFRWSAWYLYAYCLDRQAFRLFKLDRLWELTAEEGERFPLREADTDPAGFDRYFSENTVRLEAVFDGSVKYRLVEEYGADCYEEQADGSLRFLRDFASYENMRCWIASFGSSVRVLAPERLRADIAADAKKICEMYP